MFEIKTKSIINAPIDAVWSCLIDTKSYSTWNQVIRKIEGDFAENKKINMELLFLDKKTVSFTATCIKVQKPNEIRWIATFGTDIVFKGEHYFQLEKIDDNATQLIHAEKFSGIFSYLFKWLRADITEQTYNRMNEDLMAKFAS